jgi:hypothetical protein
VSGVAPVCRLYRIVKSDQPTEVDFTANDALGRPLRADSSDEARRLLNGLSMMDRQERAATLQRRFPLLGAYIAVVDIPMEGKIRIERTLREPGHHTVWGDPSELLRCVVAVTPIPASGRSEGNGSLV